MPTEFSRCSECNYHKALKLDHEFNSGYKKHIDILNILIGCGLPQEIGIIIIKKTINYNNCNTCKIILCHDHYHRALYWGYHYDRKENHAMCGSCCWFEVS